MDKGNFRAAQAAFRTEVHDIERRMLDDIMARQSSGARTAGNQFEPHGQKAPHSGEDTLTMTLLKRIQDLEAANGELRLAQARKDEEIARLKACDGRDRADCVVELDAARASNAKLLKQIADMEIFLHDYGLVWVGARDGSAEAGTCAPTQQSLTPVHMDFSLFFLRLKQLNDRVGAGKAKVVKKDGVHTFEVPAGTPFTVYANGFMLNRGPFRLYSEPTAQVFVQDIIDGYFPSELKTPFPQGIILCVIDKTSEVFEEASKPDKGAESMQPSRAGSAIASLSSIGDTSLPMTINEFISALPSTVVASGSIVDVRDNVAKMLSAETPATQLVVASCPAVPVDTPVTTIQIRSSDGRQTLVARLPFQATIADLRQVIDGHRATSKPYELRTAFPKRTFDQLEQTLESARLVPAAVVLLKDCD